jgi:hypothetical protein
MINAFIKHFVEEELESIDVSFFTICDGAIFPITARGGWE